MKIIVFSNHIAPLPAIVSFYEMSWLTAVVTSSGQLEKNQVKNLCDANGIDCIILDHTISFSKQINNLITTTVAYLGLVFGVSKKIPEVVLQNQQIRFFNVHFSLLPAYRGPAPLFWQIKNGETFSGYDLGSRAQFKNIFIRTS